MPSTTSLSLALLAAVVLAASLATVADAHARLLTPEARSPGFCASADNCEPCGFVPKAGARPAANVYARGQPVPVSWSRNNHPAGFVRFSIIPFDSDTTFSNFEKNVVLYTCHESTCKSGDPRDLNGPDPIPGTPDSNPCNATVTVPAYLKDGQYTMQWMWFSGASYYGQPDRGLSDWSGCHDFTVRGGAPVVAKPTGTCPQFLGGDAANPTDRTQCRYFGTPAPFKCMPEGCYGSYKSGIPSALAECRAGLAGHFSAIPAAKPVITSSSMTFAAPGVTKTPVFTAPAKPAATTTTIPAAVPIATKVPVVPAVPVTKPPVKVVPTPTPVPAPVSKPVVNKPVTPPGKAKAKPTPVPAPKAAAMKPPLTPAHRTVIRIMAKQMIKGALQPRANGSTATDDAPVPTEAVDEYADVPSDVIEDVVAVPAEAADGDAGEAPVG
ncbi:hypothetical protein AMAG_07021 [Allomyces macrogynus ATCC 38327]|uniref:Chitin-binding type-4 domain-containing protein n=1 Tax=Allomyces macrogynus (strain ATCC 38327) TaxID=578462 RepID=A0A0L0SFR5_ALLM3|nr:hypothetical protein AMAG_07021 [Allomyces macrogynus ATCC 38327]|eukprot:KNE61279.1 hypothetical protein AMAG_07021 [Allomyces macrogynus ATCC 38327]